MDTDVVVLSNLNDLWRNVLPEVPERQQPLHTTNNPSHQTLAVVSGNNAIEKNEAYPVMYQWSAVWPNSGFAVYHLHHMDRFWELVDELPSISHTNDQSLLSQVAKAFPQVAGTLPAAWDVHMGHGWRKAPHTLLHQQERVGMVHFTGKPPQGDSYLDASDGVLKYCLRSGSCKDSKDDYMKTWGLVDYYGRVPWNLVRYFGESQIPIGQTGYPLSIEVVV
jgi:hypothetical protein